MGQQRKKFLFLDDDAFHPDKIRHPRVYYPLIGQNELLEFMYSCDVVKFATVDGAIDHIEREGCPDFISFDNDLMREKEGIDLAKWLVDKDIENPGFLPVGFDFFVHSQNNVARERIISYLGQYLEVRSKQALTV